MALAVAPMSLVGDYRATLALGDIVSDPLSFAVRGQSTEPTACQQSFSGASLDGGRDDYVKRPDQLDVTRTPVPTLSFSAGPHFCLGAHPAMMEAEVLLHACCAGSPAFA